MGRNSGGTPFQKVMRADIRRRIRGAQKAISISTSPRVVTSQRRLIGRLKKQYGGL